jgi:hypothetical protein
MKVSGQLHVSATLPPGKGPLVNTEQDHYYIIVIVIITTIITTISAATTATAHEAQTKPHQMSRERCPTKN